MDWRDQKCDDCVHQLVLSVYTTARDEMLLASLQQEKCRNLCLAFAHEGIAEIGPFSGIGCECYEKQSEEFTKAKEKARQSIEERIFAP